MPLGVLRQVIGHTQGQARTEHILGGGGSISLSGSISPSASHTLFLTGGRGGVHWVPPAPQSIPWHLPAPHLSLLSVPTPRSRTGEGGKGSSAPLPDKVGGGLAHSDHRCHHHPTPHTPAAAAPVPAPLSYGPLHMQLHGMLTGGAQLARHEAHQQSEELHVR